MVIESEPATEVIPIAEEDQAVLDTLASINPDTMSPREALDTLYELKQLLKK